MQFEKSIQEGYAKETAEKAIEEIPEMINELKQKHLSKLNKPI